MYRAYGIYRFLIYHWTWFPNPLDRPNLDFPGSSIGSEKGLYGAVAPGIGQVAVGPLAVESFGTGDSRGLLLLVGAKLGLVAWCAHIGLCRKARRSLPTLFVSSLLRRFSF